VAKVSRPIIYAAVLGAAAYAVLLLTEPETAAQKAAKAKVKTTITAPTGFTPEDLKASFPRYAAVGRNAFQPKVVAQKKSTLGASASERLTEQWKLTGVSKIDNVVNALVESTSGETAFLKVGEAWNGMKVVAIEPTAVSLVNGKGEPSRLVFASPEEEKPTAVTTAPLLLPTPAPAAAPAVDPQQDRNARRAERRAARQGGGE